MSMSIKCQRAYKEEAWVQLKTYWNWITSVLSAEDNWYICRSFPAVGLKFDLGWVPILATQRDLFVLSNDFLTKPSHRELTDLERKILKRIFWTLISSTRSEVALEKLRLQRKIYYGGCLIFPLFKYFNFFGEVRPDTTFLCK